MDLKEFFNTDSHVSDLTVEIIASYCDEISVPKGERVVEQGKICHHIYFLTQGIGRIVYEHNGEEETVAFGAEGNAFTSMASFYAGLPSLFSLEMMEDSIFYRLKFARFRELTDRLPEFNVWFSNALVEQIYTLELRYVYYGYDNAYTRYKKLIKVQKHNINRIPLKYVAQYLQVDPATLSRIRKRYGKEK